MSVCPERRPTVSPCRRSKSRPVPEPSTLASARPSGENWACEGARRARSASRAAAFEDGRVLVPEPGLLFHIGAKQARQRGGGRTSRSGGALFRVEGSGQNESVEPDEREHSKDARWTRRVLVGAAWYARGGLSRQAHDASGVVGILVTTDL